jgi:hypothetical protein
MSDRGMMKWAPYKSLDQQGDYLAKMAYERGKKPRPLHSSEEAEVLNEFLTNYHHQAVLLKVYDDGYSREIKGVITEINSIYKYLKIADERVAFRDIIDLNDADF